ncbi:hypothetical protein BGZ65_009463, partial [Modicella reniformis]
DMINKNTVPANIMAPCARKLHEKILDHIKGRRKLEDIPDEVALATFFNPGTKEHNLFEMRVRRNHQTLTLSMFATNLLEPRETSNAAHQSDSSDDEDTSMGAESPVNVQMIITTELTRYKSYSFNTEDRRTKYINDP